MPDVSIGLVDFAGTGLFSSEYVVASKSISRFDLTVGIGWGNLGSKNNLNGNPLAVSVKNLILETVCTMMAC